ncbi:CCC motif membrane protein [Pedobacter sp. ASV28]|uniref:CCC motif membrane protein n=1 Tax=Pedobacter sp. ASV28 TaxID=2795123 RepID=UPI0018ECEEB6|nr:CCC motif membrane protein [Pedobacter sp. ASV28]
MSEELGTPQAPQPEGNNPPNQPFNNPGQFPPMGGGFGYQQALPNSTIVLVLGIISIVLCCCYGILGLIPAIIAMVLSSKDIVLYKANPNIYTQSSYKNLNAGRVCAIIGLVLNILSLIYYAVILYLFGTGVLGDPQKMQELIKGMQ